MGAGSWGVAVGGELDAVGVGVGSAVGVGSEDPHAGRSSTANDAPASIDAPTRRFPHRPIIMPPLRLLAVLDRGHLCLPTAYRYGASGQGPDGQSISSMTNVPICPVSNGSPIT